MEMKAGVKKAAKKAVKKAVKKTVKKAAKKVAVKSARSSVAKETEAPIQVYHNVRCSKSRGVCELLDKKKIKTEIIEYLKTPPTQNDIKALLKKLNIKAPELVRTNEPVFEQKYKGKTLTEAQWIKAMAEYPILIQRPVLVKGDKAIIGRPEEKVLEFIKHG